MSNIILFVFEGEKTERRIFDSLKQYFLQENSHRILCATFNADIYQLYQKIKDDSIDLVEEIRAKNPDVLMGKARKHFSEIYLFFDYDGHAANFDKTLRANDTHLMQMLEYFDNETENGKLYISYPMVEALKHLKAEVAFHETKVPAKVNIAYKKLVSEECDQHLQHIHKLERDHWLNIIEQHCKKLHFIMLDAYTLPETIFTQLAIFEAQLEKYITPENEVAVLSAFPVLLLDYYGTKRLYQILS